MGFGEIAPAVPAVPVVPSDFEETSRLSRGQAVARQIPACDYDKAPLGATNE
jgi:hypothetical protein